MNIGTVTLMIFLGLIALIGLVEAGHAVDIGMTLFGLIMTVFGVGMIFFFLKRHFDEEDARRA